MLRHGITRLFDCNLVPRLFALNERRSGVFEEGFATHVRHDLVVFVLLFRHALDIGHVFSAAFIFLGFLLSLICRNLCDLVFHLHDSIHHCDLSCCSLFLMSSKTHPYKVELIFKQLVFLNQFITLLRLMII